MIRMKEDFSFKEEFPFKICDNDGHSPDLLKNPLVHRHDCLEINYIVSGSGCYLFGDKKYDLEAGSVFFLPPAEYHMAYDLGDLKLKLILFKPELIWNGNTNDYMYLKTFYEWNENNAPFLTADMPITQYITAKLVDMEREWKTKNPGYQMMIKADLMSILGMVYRYYEKLERVENQRSHTRGNHHAILKTLDYIDAHYNEPLVLKEVASMVHMSESHFSALFSKSVQMPFSKYVLNRRLHWACIFLKNMDIAIGEVASMTGFDNISYFNRAFKSRYGVSPGEFRRKKDKDIQLA